LPDTEARAVVRNLRTSAQKLNLVAATIRGLSAEAALAQLTFSKRRIAQDVRKALQSAIANAENNHQLDVDRLYVSEASVGKSFVMKRFRPRARGRAGKIMKPWSRLTVVVREREETA
jgi:large subunit ribosomal protein L22